jgi:predicted nucleotidyltransferase
LKDKFAEVGFPYPQNLILSFIGGSQLHGAKLEGTDDTDWYGVFIEPPEKMLGLDKFEHFVYTTGGERGGNKPEDVDVCLYGLQKWARLACKGNPSVLHFVFAKPEQMHWTWAKISVQAELFLAKSHLNQFLGYANAQMRRLFNQRAKDVNRPFLEEQFGYDTKYAMHIIRLLHEAKEFLGSGRITLPRPEKELLIDIRKGKYKLYELEDMANQLEVEALAEKEKSTLPEMVDREAVSKLVTETYRNFWGVLESNDR